MQSYIKISNLNDFIFCPRSIYFHGLYEDKEQKLYHREAQTQGKISHKSIDNKTYSSRKNIIQNLEIYSSKYNLCGKLDLYDSDEQKIIERKHYINKIYDGYKYQVYAQYFCLIEMGYNVRSIAFHSLKDNKKHPLAIPNKKETEEFEKLIEKFKRFSLDDKFTQNEKKCQNCIYSPLCDYYEGG